MGWDESPRGLALVILSTILTEDEMVGWHNRLNGHDFAQAPGDGEGQGGLACCSPWGRKWLDTTQRLNNNLPELCARPGS